MNNIEKRELVASLRFMAHEYCQTLSSAVQKALLDEAKLLEDMLGPQVRCKDCKFAHINATDTPSDPVLSCHWKPESEPIWLQHSYQSIEVMGQLSELEPHDCLAFEPIKQ